MRIQNGYIISLLISFILFITLSCIENVKYDAIPFSGMELERATDYGNDWVYINLKEKKQFSGVAEGEQFDRNDWDIAFNRFNIRTNSGLSGKGNGGAYDMGKIAYNSVTGISDIPVDASFVVDDIYDISMSQKDADLLGIAWFDPNSGPAKMKSTANSVLGGAILFYAPPPMYTPSNHIYLIRGADGVSFYKLHIVSYYNTKGETGKISFKCDKLSDN